MSKQNSEKTWVIPVEQVNEFMVNIDYPKLIKDCLKRRRKDADTIIRREKQKSKIFTFTF